MLAVAGGFSLGCGPEVPAKDAQGAVKVLEAAVAAAPEHQLIVLAEGCGEIATCAGKCGDALRSSANATPDRRAQILMGCDDFKKWVGDASPDQLDQKMESFLRNRLSRFAAKAWETLGGEERKRLDSARRVLRL